MYKFFESSYGPSWEQVDVTNCTIVLVQIPEYINYNGFKVLQV